MNSISTPELHKIPSLHINLLKPTGYVHQQVYLFLYFTPVIVRFFFSRRHEVILMCNTFVLVLRFVD